MGYLNKKTFMYISYVSYSYALDIHNLCYHEMSSSCKHIQRLCSDNTWMIISSWKAWFLQPLIIRA